ncbi:MAG: hypothetical protein R3E53_07865 [Myxococcota bacterium]
MKKKRALDALSALAHETRLDAFRRLVRAGLAALRRECSRASLACRRRRSPLHLS